MNIEYFLVGGTITLIGAAFGLNYGFLRKMHKEFYANFIENASEQLEELVNAIALNNRESSLRYCISYLKTIAEVSDINLSEKIEPLEKILNNVTRGCF